MTSAGFRTLVCRRWSDPPDRSLLFSWAHLSLGDYTAETPLDSIDPFFDGLLVDIEQDHINPFCSRNLGNSITHHSGPDYSNCAYLHRRTLLFARCIIGGGTAALI